MLTNILKNMPEKFAEFKPFPQIDDREGWNALPQACKEQILKEGESFLGYLPPAITALDWLAYTRTGNRSAYEAKYYNRRYALGALVLAECCENSGRYVDDIIVIVNMICEESAWQLPAHNLYIRDTPALPMPDITRPILDLSSCETGALLATVLYLLGTRLKLVEPRVLTELENRIIRPYLNDRFWWMGGGGESTNNWTVWCVQNVLRTAFLIPQTDAVRKKIAENAVQSINAFLADYGEDGCCDEGASYYQHAGLCLFGALETLDTVTAGAFAEAWQTQKVRNIARYIADVNVGGGYYINFADCAAIVVHSAVRGFLFGKNCKDKTLCDFSAKEWARNENPVLKEETNLFNRTQAIFTAKEISEWQTPNTLEYREIFYPSAGLFIARDSTCCLAVKAGGNNDSHNHNDTGSIILYKNGKPFLIDIGVESYTKKTFSPQRYEIWTMQSSWHNLPQFDGVQQAAGEEFRAYDVETCFAADKSTIKMQLKNAWPKESGLQSYTRTVTLEKGKKVTLQDNCAGSFKKAVLNLMFSTNPSVQNGKIVLDGLGSITLEGAENIETEVIDIKDERLLQSWPEKLYRARVAFGGEIKLDII